MGFLNSIIKNSGNKYASVVDDGVEADVNGFVDTGSYAFNALLSGSLYGGIASNKILALAGESATGKTYFALGIVSKFLQDNKEGVVLYFDSEQAVTSSMFIDRDVDPKRVAVFPVATIEDFRHQAISIVDKILEEPEAKRKPVMIVLDSLGMLSTSKEMRDTAEGKDTRDMTRAQVVKATFRTLTLKLGKANIPMIMTNHTYQTMSLFPTAEMSGGCLVAGTEVCTKNGLVPIDQLAIGDDVLTLFGYRSVVDTFQFDDKELYEIEFEDGSVVKCSAEHKFMVESDDGYVWIAAKDIIEGFALVEMDSSIHMAKEPLCSTTPNTPNGIFQS